MYRIIALAITTLTGFSGLVFQVAWQKYLSYLVGSEARSISLVVAVFLLGLAMGYRFWGGFTRKRPSRKFLLRTYGLIEGGIGIYACVFPWIFPNVFSLIPNLPNNLFVDFLVTAALILPPTFLMGATIPMLTSVLPDKSSEIHGIHAKVYGYNALGAVVGVYMAGFWMVPKFGLKRTLTYSAMANGVAFLVFCFNRLTGNINEKPDSISIPKQKLPDSFTYIFTFLTGAIYIALEILSVRVLGLTIGMGFYVFPIVLGIFVLGISIGSLTFDKVSESENGIFKEILKTLLGLSVIYFTIPFWPYWLNHIKVSLLTHPATYWFYLTLITVFFAALILPALIPFGRLLPFAYTWLDKKADNYGKVCGNLYLANTIGTIFGSVFLGYVLLFWLNIDKIFLISIITIALLAALMAFKLGKKIVMYSALVFILAMLLAPKWERQTHANGLFRVKKLANWHFKKVFESNPVKIDMKDVYLEDGPNTTVSAIPYKNNSMSLFVNGKSDGNSLGDFSTTTLLSSIPYLFAPDKHDLKSAVIGFGTGISSGLLTNFNDISRVEIIEISPFVLKATDKFKHVNYDPLKSKKTHLYETDAFKYFSRKIEKLDIVVSEPSNPWVAGVENLYTPEFNKLVKNSLNEDGLYFGWMHYYDSDLSIFNSVIKNVKSAFKHVRIYGIGSSDVGFLASNATIPTNPNANRFKEQFLNPIFGYLKIITPELLPILELANSTQTEKLSSDHPVTHTLDHPIISYESAFHFFLSNDFGSYDYAHFPTSRYTYQNDKKRLAFEQMEKYVAERKIICENTTFSTPLCKNYSFIKNQMNLLNIRDPRKLKKSLEAYNFLRTHGFMDRSKKILTRISQNTISQFKNYKPQDRQIALRAIVLQHYMDMLYPTGDRLLRGFSSIAKFNASDLNKFETKLKNFKNNLDVFFEKHPHLRPPEDYLETTLVPTSGARRLDPPGPPDPNETPK